MNEAAHIKEDETNPPCYEVKDWNKHFENSESRKYKSLTWVPVKNKHDGKGYRRVCQHPKSVAVFCAWNLIVQVASKMPTRGLLCDEDGPLTTSDLSFKTGFPESIFTEAFKVLTDINIGWIVKSSPGNLRRSAETAGETTVEQNRTEQNRMREPAREDFAEIQTEAEALASTMTAGIPTDFARFVYQDWASRAGKDAGGVQVKFLPYVSKRWAREQVEWRAKTHKGIKDAPKTRHDGAPKLLEVSVYAKQKWGDDARHANWATSFFSFWNDPKRDWKRKGNLIDWKTELTAQVAKWRG